MKEDQDNVSRLAAVASEMIAVADKGHAECRDENCVSLFGLAKDCAYRIKSAAELESRAHGVSVGGMSRKRNKLKGE